MNFNSITFIVFLVLVFWGWRSLPFGWGKRFLCAASLFFYAFWFPPFVILLLASAVVSFFAARWVSQGLHDPGKVLFAALAGNLFLLLFFKYADFFIEAVNLGFSQFNMVSQAPVMGMILPMGISFYTLQGMAYVLDTYRKEIKPVQNWTDFLLFMSFFPQLVAGPIVRAGHFIPQIRPTPSINPDVAVIALNRILRGLFLKVVLADNIAPYVFDIFSKNPLNIGSGEAWLGAFMFSIQIFCDFAGYSDIAIGTAKLFGFTLPENFKNPYLSLGFKDFWRRWHISLSTWFRDYVYRPSGGNRRGTVSTGLNVMAVFLLSGLWHGANWTFLLWGFIHGVFLLLERVFRAVCGAAGFVLPAALRPFLVIMTVILVVFAWVPFRAQSIQHCWGYWCAMFNSFQLTELRISGTAFLTISLFLAFQFWMGLTQEFSYRPRILTVNLESAVYFFLILYFPGYPVDFIYFQF